MYENRVLRRIFRPKRDEVTGEWRKVYEELYSSPNIIRVIKSRKNEMGMGCSMYGGEETCRQGFGGKT
jgi:hypothetical protein